MRLFACGAVDNKIRERASAMAIHYGQKFIHTTMHDFKSNISKYIRVLQRGVYDGVIVKRYNEPMGLFVLMESAKKPKPKSDQEALVELLEKLAE